MKGPSLKRRGGKKALRFWEQSLLYSAFTCTNILWSWPAWDAHMRFTRFCCMWTVTRKKITNQLAKNTSPPMKHMHSATHKKMAFSNSLKVQQKQIEILCTQIATHQSGVPEEQRALHTDALLRSPLAAEVLHHRHANPKRRQVSSHYVQLYNPQLV